MNKKNEIICDTVRKMLRTLKQCNRALDQSAQLENEEVLHIIQLKNQLLIQLDNVTDREIDYRTVYENRPYMRF